jgi:predicted anti-sigma-YlaC factor YlaD
MDCSHCREAISARLDGESLPVEPVLIEGHLRGCPRCRAFAAGAARLDRDPRLGFDGSAPDLTASILHRLGVERRRAAAGASARVRDARVGLGILAGLQLVLALPALFGQSAGTSVHAAHELGSFDVAIAVGFLVAALRPRTAVGLLPVMVTLTALLAGTSLFDVLAGHVPATGEALHVVDAVGVGLLWLAGAPILPRSPVERVGRAKREQQVAREDPQAGDLVALAHGVQDRASPAGGMPAAVIAVDGVEAAVRLVGIAPGHEQLAGVEGVGADRLGAGADPAAVEGGPQSRDHHAVGRDRLAARVPLEPVGEHWRFGVAWLLSRAAGHRGPPGSGTATARGLPRPSRTDFVGESRAAGGWFPPRGPRNGIGRSPRRA